MWHGTVIVTYSSSSEPAETMTVGWSLGLVSTTKELCCQNSEDRLRLALCILYSLHDLYVKLTNASLFFSWMVTLAHTIYYSQPHLISGSLQYQPGLLFWDISHGLCLGWSDFSLGCLLILLLTAVGVVWWIHKWPFPFLNFHLFFKVKYLSALTPLMLSGFISIWQQTTSETWGAHPCKWTLFNLVSV